MAQTERHRFTMAPIHEGFCTTCDMPRSADIHVQEPPGLDQVNLFNQMVLLVNDWQRVPQSGGHHMSSPRQAEPFEEFVTRLAVGGDHGAASLIASSEFLKIRSGMGEAIGPESHGSEGTRQYLIEALNVAWAYTVDYSDDELELRAEHAHQVRLRKLFEIDPIGDSDLAAAVAHVNRGTMAEDKPMTPDDGVG